MPNRILRPWTDSEAIDKLTVYAERFFTRLIMIVDDHGRFPSNPKLLRSAAFPLKDDVREADISRWLNECELAGLILLYEVAEKGYLEIQNFNQRLRQKVEKYPHPQQNDGQLTVNSQTIDGVKRREEKRSNTNSSSRSATKQTDSAGMEKKPLEERQSEFYKELIPYVPKYGSQMVRAFYDYWSEPNRTGSKMKMEMEKTWHLPGRLQRWENNNFEKHTPKPKERGLVL